MKDFCNENIEGSFQKGSPEKESLPVNSATPLSNLGDSSISLSGSSSTSNYCRHCGGCQFHDRCDHCGKCRNCGIDVLVPYSPYPVPISPFPHPFNPYPLYWGTITVSY